MTQVIRHVKSPTISVAFIGFGLFCVAFAISNKIKPADCEHKDFDWGDFGVSLTGPKSAIQNSAANNLRILVSPQRRMTKNYDSNYGNSSQPTSSQGETSYIIPGSTNSYIAQTSSQLASNQAHGHSSAYSALSASLASLKSRLNARGVTLSSPISENGLQSNLYSNSQDSYGSSVVSESQQPQSQQAHSQSQPTYLSVTSQQEQQSTGGYNGGPNQSSDNKTIVLAIPAKINFLTDGRSSSSGTRQTQSQLPQQQAQQVTVFQPTSEQQARFGGPHKQLGIDGLDHASSFTGHDSNQDQEQQHQYVILNSPPQLSEQSNSLISSGVASAPLISNLYPTAQQTSYAMKLMPSIQKIYPSTELGANYESYVSEGSGLSRYSSCLDTCNSADPRWRKFTISKYKFCCSRSPQNDAHLEQPSMDKLSDNTKHIDDAYQNYLYRKTRSRRSRNPRGSSTRYHKYLTGAPLSPDDDGFDPVSSDSERYGPAHSQYDGSKYKIRQEAMDPVRDSADIPSASFGKHGIKTRSYRRSRSRDFEPSELHQSSYNSDDDSSLPMSESSRSSSGYGSGEYSVDAGRYPIETRPASSDDDDTRSGYDDSLEVQSNKGNPGVDEYNFESTTDGASTDESDSEVTDRKQSAIKRKKHARSRSRKYGKESRSHKKGRRAKHARQSEAHSSQATNITDHETVQSGDRHHQDSTNLNEDDQTYQRDSINSDSGDMEKEAILIANKYKSSLNDSTVANLSKTTMHLKEILSLLEKKAQLKANESSGGGTLSSFSTTPPSVPTTTTGNNLLSLYASQYNGSPSEYAIASDLDTKNPYRFASSSLPSSYGSSSLSLPSTYGSLGTDSFGSLPTYGSSNYGLASTKHFTHSQYPRKRRIYKNNRYPNMIVPKTQGLGVSYPLVFSGSSRGAYMNPGYYSSLQYPYWYTRGSSPSVINSYPYKNAHKNPYSALIGGQAASKLPTNAAASVTSGNLYSDESRYHGSTSYDPMTNVASSLRPTRLRSKPFVLQPHVLPIYTRHTILTQPIDVRK